MMTDPRNLLAVPPPDVIPYPVAAQAIRHLDHVSAVVTRRYGRDWRVAMTLQAAAGDAAQALVPWLEGWLAIGDDPPVDQPLREVVAEVRTMLAQVTPTGTGVDLLAVLALVNALDDRLATLDDTGSTDSGST